VARPGPSVHRSVPSRWMTVKVAFAVAPPPAAVTFPLPVVAPAGIVISFENPPLPFAVTVPKDV
jgi:hypothetical protein